MLYHNRSPSPISTLPVELLSEIFTLCALSAGDEASPEDGSDATPLVHTGTLAAALLLSGVNRRWRSVVRNQANLWSNICVSAQLLQDVDVDEDKEMGAIHGQRTSRLILNTKPIVSCLARSRQYPLNIMIDARDENWNFVEPNVGDADYEVAPSSILFSSMHMHSVVSLLLPHIARWKSLTILTDTWAPMHTALNAINPCITALGAPQLQWLTLMRCNEFASFSPKFQPRNLKEPAFLSGAPARVLLPRLQHLSLRGVHVDWTALSRSVTPNLSSLDLQSHSPDVRPTLDQFTALLLAAPALHTLTVSGSGPELPDDIPDIPEDIAPVALHALHTLAIGYRSAFDGRLLLETLDAANTRALTLEDATYPGDPEEVNASGLLTYLGAKQARAEDAHPTRGAFSSKTPPRALFPLLERVALRQVKSSASALRTFFSGLAHLQHLELATMPMHAVHALLPPSPSPSQSQSPSPRTSPSPSPSPRAPTSPSTSPPNCPCPHLHTLLLKHPLLPSHLPSHPPSYLPDLSSLSPTRQRSGACPLREVNLVCEDDDGDDDDDNEEEDNGDSLAYVRDAEEADAFKPGGAFNDPDFDAYYALRLSSLSSLSVR